MKIIKLDKRYRYWHKGFTYAIRWSGYNHTRIEPYSIFMERHYGSEYLYENLWCQGHGSIPKYGRRNYYLYVRDERMLTMAMLGVQN